jgi:hypothetical protein
MQLLKLMNLQSVDNLFSFDLSISSVLAPYLYWWWNMLGDNVNTINKNTEALIDASNELGPKVNT